MKKHEYEGFFVYFYYDENDTLLYVGLTTNLKERWGGHQEDWTNDISKIVIREYPDHAGMAIYERYYISKLAPVHNKQYLEHGTTNINLPDPYPETTYEREEYIKKFVYKTSRKKPVQYFTIQESLEAKGYTVVHTKSINLADEKLLEYNLDKTVFMFDDTYVSLNSNCDKFSNRKLSTPIANGRLEALQYILSHAIITHDMRICGITIDEEMLNNAMDACCISIKDIRRFRNGREYSGGFSHRWYVRSTIVEKDDNSATFMYEIQLDSSRQEISISQNKFTFDLSTFTKRNPCLYENNV